MLSIHCLVKNYNLNLIVKPPTKMKQRLRLKPSVKSPVHLVVPPFMARHFHPYDGSVTMLVFCFDRGVKIVY